MDFKSHKKSFQLTILMTYEENTSFGFGRYDRFTSPKSKQMLTDIMH